MTETIHSTLFGPAGMADATASDWRNVIARVADDCLTRAYPDVISRWDMDLNGFATSEDIETLRSEDGGDHLRFLLDALSEYSGLIEVAARQSLAMGILLGAAIAQTYPETLAEREAWPDRAARCAGLRTLAEKAWTAS